MQLEISKEIEASIHSKAIASGFQTVEEYILNRLEIDDAVVDLPPDESRTAWLKKFDALVERQTSRNPGFDDSRETIYPAP